MSSLQVLLNGDAVLTEAMMARSMLVLAGAGALLGCAMNGEGAPGGASTPPAQATATLRDASGKTMGSATALQVDDTVHVRIEAMGLTPGIHGAHVHTTGTCTGPGFESAGPHWNPGSMQHGKDNPAGMHKGDLPNIEVGADGRGVADYVVANAWVTGNAGALLDADGAAIVIHASADDYRTDPSGNSGGRIACGVFR